MKFGEVLNYIKCIYYFSAENTEQFPLETMTSTDSTEAEVHDKNS
jgi:hypothetical protein